MAKQETLSDMEYAHRRKRTRREEMLSTMDQIIDWPYWIAQIAPHYPDGKRGRPPRGIELMLRMYLVAYWFDLSAQAAEEMACDSYAVRNFLGINFLEEQAPDSATLLHFKKLLEDHLIDIRLHDEITSHLQSKGLTLRYGNVREASLVRLPKK